METVEKAVSKMCKLSHKQFRAILKKFRRKKIRQQLAKEKEQKEISEQQKRESSPGYIESQEEIRRNSQLYEEFEERERIRKHKLWLLREQQAQEEFKRKQKQLELDKIKREEERKRILEEFEKQEFVEKQAQEEVKKIKSQKEVDKWNQLFAFIKLEALQQALSNLSEADGPWHNPIAPENYNVGKEREQCMFFSKTGCCRFGERCSRGHTRPPISSTILIRGMYSHFSIDQTARDDYDTDIALEYEDKECYQHFKNFYNDVLPEFKRFGRVIQFKVCNNFEPHLRGNVYVQYAREEDAMEAYKTFNGRYYAGKQITCEFTHVIRWRSAICGLYGRKMCPKGINCNFLHVFKNPNDEFWEADRDLPQRNKHDSDSSRRNHSKDDRSYHGSEYKDRHSFRSSKHDSRSESRERRSDRYESRNDRHEHRSERYDSRNDRYESRSERYESRSDRYESRNDKYESRNHHKVRSSESNSDSSEENYYTHSKKISKNSDNHSSKSRKRTRSPSSRSRSNSPSNSTSQKKHSHKKKKHKKKKSKKSEKKESSESSIE